MSLPPVVPLIACYCFIAYLLWKDARDEPPVGSNSLWITGTWLALMSSRSVGAWLFAIFGSGSRGSDLEGSPVDVIVISFLIVRSIMILNNRGFRWGVFFGSNKTILAIYVYFFFSLFWADYPFVVVKRVIKDFGLVFLGLVIATEPNWSYAIRKLFLRVGYILFPLSVVLIKWFPSIGRTSSAGGESMFGGVTVHKNSLGQVLLVFGLILVWDLIEHVSRQKIPWKDPRVVRRLILLYTHGWLLITANSQTSVVCLVLGLILYWFSGKVLKSKAPKLVFAAGAMFAVTMYSLDSTFKIKDTIVESVGRKSDLSGRTRIWEIVMSQDTNPLLGCGFMMFWDSEYGEKAIDAITVRLNSAHNGYLDVYLDGGAIGLGLLILMLGVGGIKVLHRLFLHTRWGRLGFVYYSIALLYNLSESDFFRLGSLWTVLLMTIATVPRENEPPDLESPNPEFIEYDHDDQPRAYVNG